MNIRKDIPLEEFELIISPPTNRLAAMCVNIYSDGRFNLNGKLIEKIGCSKVSIRFTRDGKYLCLAENGDISFPKAAPVSSPICSKSSREQKSPFRPDMKLFTANQLTLGRGVMQKTLPNCHPKKSAAQGSTLPAKHEISDGFIPFSYTHTHK